MVIAPTSILGSGVTAARGVARPCELLTIDTQALTLASPVDEPQLATAVQDTSLMSLTVAVLLRISLVPTVGWSHIVSANMVDTKPGVDGCEGLSGALRIPAFVRRITVVSVAAVNGTLNARDLPVAAIRSTCVPLAGAGGVLTLVIAFVLEYTVVVFAVLEGAVVVHHLHLLIARAHIASLVFRAVLVSLLGPGYYGFIARGVRACVPATSMVGVACELEAVCFDTSVSRAVLGVQVEVLDVLGSLAHILLATIYKQLRRIAAFWFIAFLVCTTHEISSKYSTEPANCDRTYERRNVSRLSWSDSYKAARGPSSGTHARCNTAMPESHSVCPLHMLLNDPYSLVSGMYATSDLVCDYPADRSADQFRDGN
ncbi:hypothetical protein SCAR479_05142 [Seiridium cardinale]|uniref:Uncharacterized protein n=1 Tax=Seiridium cardinale TaxID=138064 RepID=A0ABR2XWM5_9PEZI